jgi:hypothetical protein
VDNSVKILADFIVKDKQKVIRFLNEGGYASLPRYATTMEVNYAVSEHIFDQQFLEGISELIFRNYRNQSGPPPPLADVGGAVTSGGEVAEGANPWTYVIKIAEVGAKLFVQAKQAENQRAVLTAQSELSERQLEYQTELARQKAKQQFAFNLLQAQQDSPEKTTKKNLILLFGVIAFLGIAYYATKKSSSRQIS